MALFSRNTKETTQEAPAKTSAPKVAKEGKGSSADLTQILRHARITEKASMHQAESVYTFDISEDATKRQVAQAFFAIYKIMPRKIAILSVPSKVRRSMRTGKVGMKRGGRKAYVYLKKGETVTIG